MSKRISKRLPEFTIEDLQAWLDECVDGGMPTNARVYGMVGWRGVVKEVWVDDEKLAPRDLGDVLYRNGEPYGEVPVEGYAAGGARFDERTVAQRGQPVPLDYDKDKESAAGIYVPPQQLTRNGPMHGGFTYKVNPENGE